MFSLHECTLIRAGKTLIQELHWHIAAGEVWGILGANGVGKSSLLMSMAGLLHCKSGRIEFNSSVVHGLPRKTAARHIAYLPQEFSFDFPVRVWDWAMMSRYPHQGPWGRSSPADQQIVSDVLVQTQLAELSHRWVSELSGGERQRLALAGVLIQRVPWLLLDEPTNHLDIHFQVQLLPQLIRASHNQGGAVVMSLHDVNLAAVVCSHCLLLLGDGDYFLGTKEDVLTQENISRLYRHPVNAWQLPQGIIFQPKLGDMQ